MSKSLGLCPTCPLFIGGTSSTISTTETPRRLIATQAHSELQGNLGRKDRSGPLKLILQRAGAPGKAGPEYETSQFEVGDDSVVICTNHSTHENGGPGAREGIGHRFLGLASVSIIWGIHLLEGQFCSGLPPETRHAAHSKGFVEEHTC